jgi:nucleoside-triphosphatase
VDPLWQAGPVGERQPKVLLEGRPGVGKTTVVRRLAGRLRDAGIPVGGFTTRELRERGRRTGFVAEEIDGPEALIAHVDWTDGITVGRYRVDTAALDRIALPAMLHAQQRGGVLLVDELGRMELASTACREAFRAMFDRDMALVATVHAVAHPESDALKRRPDVALVRVTPANRDDLPRRLGDLLARARGGLP